MFAYGVLVVEVCRRCMKRSHFETVGIQRKLGNIRSNVGDLDGFVIVRTTLVSYCSGTPLGLTNMVSNGPGVYRIERILTTAAPPRSTSKW